MVFVWFAVEFSFNFFIFGQAKRGVRAHIGVSDHLKSGLAEKIILGGYMNEEERLEELDFLKKRLKRKFVEMEDPMKQIEFTRENYKKLFPDNRITTPIGSIKIGEHQYEKLEVKKLQDYLGAMYQTLTDPIVIIKKEDNRGKAQLFSKSFEHRPKKKDGVISVIADIDGENVSISTHPKYLKRVIDEIKNAADLVYEKPNQRLDGWE